jgi:hypothetical protein
MNNYSNLVTLPFPKNIIYHSANTHTVQFGTDCHCKVDHYLNLTPKHVILFCTSDHCTINTLLDSDIGDYIFNILPVRLSQMGVKVKFCIRTQLLSSSLGFNNFSLDLFCLHKTDHNDLVGKCICLFTSNIDKIIHRAVGFD